MNSPVLALSFALLAAVLFGVSVHAVRQGLKYLDPQSGTVVSIGTTVVCLALISPWWMHLDEWRNRGVWVFALGGLLHPVFSRLMAYEANRRVGATVSATFDGTSPLFAAGMAMAALGEHLTLPIAAGTVLTATGVIVLYWNPSVPGKVMQAAALFALGAAVLRALIGVIGKFGLTILPNPLMGAFIAYCVSTIAASVILGVRSRCVLPEFPRPGVLWFILVGVLTSIAVSGFFSALLYGDVIVVTPIVSTAPLFTMLAALVLGIERLTPRIVSSVLLVAVGVVLVSIGRG